MGPRFDERGKVVDDEARAIELQASMGPRFDERGKASGSIASGGAGKLDVMGPLGFDEPRKASPVIRIRAGYSSFNGAAASMSRAESLRPAETLRATLKARFQWGRAASMSRESPAGHVAVPESGRELHWGRASMSAESESIGYMYGFTNELQWGRASMSAESSNECEGMCGV